MNRRVKKSLKELSSLVCWVVLLSSGQTLVGAIMIPIGTPTKCIGTGQVPIPTSAQIIPEEVFMAYPAQSYLSVSKIVCASYSFSKKAIAFSHQGGTCTIYGSGDGVYRNDNDSFFAYPDIPPAEDLEDISLFKPTYASEAHSSGSSKDHAVNGIYINDDMFESKSGFVHPWWIVDLTEVRTIHQVQIFTRQNWRPERLRDIEIRIGQELVLDGDMSSYTLMSTYKGPYDVSQGHIICSNLRGVDGKFLGIKIVNNDMSVLQLVEVRIYAAKKT